MGMENTAAHSLDRMREGGTYVVALAVQRLDETKQALLDGDFPLAARRGQEALARTRGLSQAFLSLGEWDAQRIIRGFEVEEGMSIWGWGKVEEIEDSSPDPHEDGDEIIVARLDTGEQKRFYGQQEVVLVLDDEELHREG